MNKKAAIFHWILFGVGAAIMVFAVLIYKPDIKFETQGQWQLDFLNNYYFAAEKDLLQIDQNATQAVWDSILRLGNTGGFHENIPCGRVSTPTTDFVLWNKGKDRSSCSFQIEAELIKEIDKNLKLKLKERKYSEIKLKDNVTFAKGNQKIIHSKNTDKYYVQYTYDTSFRFNLGFDIKEEYLNLSKHAVILIEACKKDTQLEKCIKKVIKEKQPNWKLTDCDKEKFYASGRKVAFCVESPQQIKLYNQDKKLTLLRHKLALDFAMPTS